MSKYNSILEKYQKVINEEVVNQGKFITTIMKGFEKDSAGKIVYQVAMSLWHYADPRIVGNKGKNVIFKTKPSHKTVMDELWHRTASGLVDGEHLTKNGINQLKKNFANISKYFKDWTLTDYHGKDAWVIKEENQKRDFDFNFNLYESKMYHDKDSIVIKEKKKSGNKFSVECMECGKKFKTSKTFDVKCPK